MTIDPHSLSIPQTSPDDATPPWVLSFPVPDADVGDGLSVRLRALIDGYGANPNKNELVTAAIALCITGGVDTKSRIISTLIKFGFKHGHVASNLQAQTGRDPVYFWWRCDNGVYGLL
jgi:hypothetical protein